jgi:hypothetical protein
VDEPDADPTPGSSASRPLWRLAACVTAVTASILLSVVAWAGHNSVPPSSAGTASHHRLTADQAACLRFGFITSRSDARQLGTVLGSYSTLDPKAAVQLRDEVDALDEISADNPDADYRLVARIAASADAGAAVLLAGGSESYRGMVAERAQAIFQTEQLCRSLAGFDTSTLTLTQDEKSDG